MPDPVQPVTAPLDRVHRWLRRADDGLEGDFEAFFTPGYAGHRSGRIHLDLAQLQRLERGFARAFGAVERRIDGLWGAGDRVVLRVTTRATHRGEFNGIPPTGRTVVMTGLVVYRFREGRIARSWGELDFAGLGRQLTAPASR